MKFNKTNLEVKELNLDELEEVIGGIDFFGVKNEKEDEHRNETLALST